jgi:hypothetical protein
MSIEGAAKIPELADHEADVAEPPIVPLSNATPFSQTV